MRYLKAREAARTHAWYIHSFISFGRVTEIILELGWFGTVPNCTEINQKNCLGDYNRELMDSNKDVLYNILVALVFVGIGIDIACIRWRFVAHACFYHECLQRVIAVLIPSYYGYNMDAYNAFLAFSITFIVMYCDDQVSMFVSTLAYGFHCVWLEVAYNHELTGMQAFVIFFLMLLLFTGECAAGMVNVKISNLYRKLDNSNR